MQKLIDSFQRLIENSIPLDATTTACDPNNKEEKELNLPDVNKYELSFAQQDLTLCYVWVGRVFAAPYTREAVSILKESMFEQADFPVPFADGSYPKYEAEKWFKLRELANESYDRDLEDDCKKWCEGRISKLPKDVMKNCFKIPRNGVKVVHHYETTYYPACGKTKKGDRTDISKLGCFCARDGKVVFACAEGTFVAKGHKIIEMLRNAGFIYTQMTVPFGPNEMIVDPKLAKKWDDIEPI